VAADDAPVACGREAQRERERALRRFGIVQRDQNALETCRRRFAGGSESSTRLRRSLGMVGASVGAGRRGCVPSAAGFARRSHGHRERVCAQRRRALVARSPASGPGRRQQAAAGGPEDPTRGETLNPLKMQLYGRRSRLLLR
jgi:hypothetical protein